MTDRRPFKTNFRLSKLVEQPIALWLARLILGLVFLIAAWPKLMSPLNLAETIVEYRLVPLRLVPFLALFLPSVELWSALAVLAGPRRFRRAGALILALSLLIFMAAAAQGLARGLDFECGCFGSADARKPGLLFFIEDSLLFLTAIFIFMYDDIRKIK